MLIAGANTGQKWRREIGRKREREKKKEVRKKNDGAKCGSIK